MPLVDAVQNRDLSAVKKCIAAGDSPDSVSNESGENALAIAAFNGDLEIVMLLLSASASPNSLGTTAWPLSNAAGQGHTQIVEALLFAEAEVDSTDEDGGTALSDASAGGHLEIVQLLIEGGANPKHKDRYGKRAITYAAEKGHTRIVAELSQFATENEINQVSLLLKLAGQGPPGNEIIDFLDAAESGDIDAVRMFLESGGNVDAMAEDGRTAVFGAARRGHVDILKLLCSHGADMNHIDTYGSFPLVSAGQKSGNPAYDLVYSLTNQKLRKDWESRERKAREIAEKRGYL